MRRLLLPLAVLVLLAAGYGGWRLLSSDEPAPTARRDGAADRTARPAGATPLDAVPEVTPALERPLVEGGDGLEILVSSAGTPQPGAAVRVYLHRPVEPGTGRPGWRLAAEATTGADGAAHLGAAPGAYLISARAAGLAPALVEVVRPTGEATTRVAVALLPPVSLAGSTVERATGAPLPATALVLSREPERGAPAGDLPAEERAYATSDGRGHFSIGGLAPGRYTLEAEAAGHARVRLPGLEVPRGELSVALSAAGLVEGRVLGPDGAPAEGAEVAFTGGDQVLVVLSGPSGGFAAELPPHTYRVAARRGEAAAAWPAPVVVAAGQVVRGVELTLGAPATIAGVVVTSGGEPVGGATLGLSPAGEGGELQRLQAGADGRFTFRGVAPGAYDLDAGAEGFAPLLRRGLLVAASEQFELRLVLPGTGAVEGLVTDGQGRPVAGARVRGGKLWGGLGQVDAEAVSGDDGWYRLAGLEPGRTTVKARRSEALSGAARLVRVEEGQAVRADFTLPGSGAIEGVVRGPGGRALTAPVRVILLQAGGGRMAGRQPEPVITSGDGAFQATVAEGTWRLVALGEGERRAPRSAPATAEVEAGRTARVELTLEEDDPAVGGTLEVEVREPGGTPSPGAVVLTQRAGARGPLAFPADETGRVTLPLVAGEAALAPLSVGARSGGRFAPLQLVPQGATAQVIQLLPAATLRGQVLDLGRPVSGFTLALEAGDDTPDPGRELTRELPGSGFALADLPPGTHHLTVLTADGRTGTAQVVLAAGREGAVTVEVRRGGAVAGRIVDAEGAPVAGAFVTVGGRELGGEGTGADGRFRIQGVEAGPQPLQAFLPRVGGATRTVEVLAGQVVELGDVPLAIAGGGMHHP